METELYQNQFFKHKEYLKKVLGDSLAPLQIFNAILHSLFSAASKLRTTVHDIRRMLFFIM
jgi:hypothetical protein